MGSIITLMGSILVPEAPPKAVPITESDVIDINPKSNMKRLILIGENTELVANMLFEKNTVDTKKLDKYLNFQGIYSLKYVKTEPVQSITDTITDSISIESKTTSIHIDVTPRCCGCYDSHYKKNQPLILDHLRRLMKTGKQDNGNESNNNSCECVIGFVKSAGRVYESDVEMYQFAHRLSEETKFPLLLILTERSATNKLGDWYEKCGIDLKSKFGWNFDEVVSVAIHDDENFKNTRELFRSHYITNRIESQQNIIKAVEKLSTTLEAKLSETVAR